MQSVYLSLLLFVFIADLIVLLVDYFIFTKKTNKLKLENAELQNKINYLLINELERKEK